MTTRQSPSGRIIEGEENNITYFQAEDISFAGAFTTERVTIQQVTVPNAKAGARRLVEVNVNGLTNGSGIAVVGISRQEGSDAPVPVAAIQVGSAASSNQTAYLAYEDTTAPSGTNAINYMATVKSSTGDGNMSSTFDGLPGRKSIKVTCLKA